MTFTFSLTSPRARCLLGILGIVTVLAVEPTLIAGEPEFRAGFAKRDITPQEPMPMWGYGDRHDKLSTGTIHPLHAKAIVIHAGKDKVALVGLDLGRGPTSSMTHSIRQAIREQAAIEHLMISGSHTHHGPCIELLDHSGFGKDKFPAAVAYNLKLSGLLVEAILEADQNAIPARIGVSTRKVNLNRNRHSKRSPKAVDPMLSVIRLDAHEGDREGQPIAVLVNYAAHPTMTDTHQLKFSADYPGFLQDKVEHDLDTGCVFMQGAAGDMSVNPPTGVHGPQAYGERLAAEVIELVIATQGEVPKKSTLRGRVDHFHFKSRVDFTSPLIAYAYGEAFYPELIRCFTKELQAGIPPELNTVVLNGQLALIGGSGEFFCNHANRLKTRSYLPHTLFFGYCNDHYLYFPTIEAVSEGGYGADPPVSPVEVGAGEQMMNQALKNIYTLVGKIAPEKSTTAKP
jgi:neutral ceramidase